MVKRTKRKNNRVSRKRFSRKRISRKRISKKRISRKNISRKKLSRKMMKGGDLRSAKILAKKHFPLYTKIDSMKEDEFRRYCERKLRDSQSGVGGAASSVERKNVEKWTNILRELNISASPAGGVEAVARSKEDDDIARAIAASLATQSPARSEDDDIARAIAASLATAPVRAAAAVGGLEGLEREVNFRKPVGEFCDPLVRDPAEHGPRAKYARFFDEGGRVIYAPPQATVSEWVESGAKPWSIGIRNTDYLIPVCHQGMNRSQVMRLVLTGVRKELGDTGGVNTEWVSRAHGAVSGCDAHSAWQRGTLTEENFIVYMFDTGEIFAEDYNPRTDTDPQSGPLQRGFVGAFGVYKKPRFGEEMARGKKLNPTSEYVPPKEWLEIGGDRQYTHEWFNKFMFAPMTHIRKLAADEKYRMKDSEQGENMIPPEGATRRIFFAFARAVPNLVERLLEVPGGPLNTVIVSLNYDDTMNHELRHLGGKTEQQVRDKMVEVHQKAYRMYAKLVHADPDVDRTFISAPETEQVVGQAEPEPETGKDFSQMSFEQLQRELEAYKSTRNTIKDIGGDVGQIQADIDKIQREMIKYAGGA